MNKPSLRVNALNGRMMTSFEAFLSGREFGGCFCAVWREFGADWEERCRSRSHENLESTRRAVKSGMSVGFLISNEDTGEVLAWTGAGPKTSFPLLKDKPGSRKGPFDDSVWAIGCLAIGFKHRGLKLSRAIVEAVINEAKKGGARSIEAYPLESSDEHGAYRGSKALFEMAGFHAADSEPSGDSTVFRMVRDL